MAQRWPAPDPLAAISKVTELARRPALAASIGQVLGRMGAVAALYRGYPPSHGRRLRAFSRAAATLFAEPADIR
jgi:hypothetical protein